MERDPLVGFEEGDQVDGGLFQAKGHAGLGLFLTELAQPFPERFGRGVNRLGPALTAAGVNEL